MAVIPLAEYLFHPVFDPLSRRLLTFTPRINLLEHIDVMQEIGRTHSEGVTFRPKDAAKFRRAVAGARNGNQLAFHWDNRKVWVNKLAALFTDGEGYREIGQPSLHIAIGKDTCNVHLDEFGFVAFGPDGKPYFHAGSVGHVGDELFYRAIIRPKLMLVLGKALPNFLAAPALKLMDHSYLVLPNQKNNFGFDINKKWKPRVGMGLQFKPHEKVKLRFEYTCGNRSCSDNRQMAIVELQL